MGLKKLIGENIKKIREAKDISQGELAKRMKVDPSYVSSLEKGLRNPSIGSLEKVATALSVDPISLLENSSKTYFHEMEYVSGLTAKKINQWKNKEWYHQRFDGSPYLIHMIGEAEIITRREEKGKLAFNHHFCFFEDGKADWYIDMEEMDQISQAVLKLGEKNPNIGQELISRWQEADDLFYKKCQEIDEINLRKLSDSRLINLHDNFVNSILDRNSSSSIIDGFALGTDRFLEEKLKQAYENSSLKSSIKFTELFAKLTAPTHLSFVRQAEIELMELIIKINANKSKKRKYIEDYRDKFFWIRNNYIDANVLTVDYFEQEIAQVESSNTDLKKDLKDLKDESDKAKKEKDTLLKTLKPDKITLLLLRTTDDFTSWQDERKKATLFTAHYAILILSEIAARLHLSVDLIKYLSPREVSQVFQKHPSQENLEARRQSSVMYWDEDGHEVITGPKVNKIKEDLLGSKKLLEVQDFRGLTASLGKASGKVRILKSVRDINTLENGEVLVAVMTRPDYVPAMKKASAIVTDEGGITSHAAIVSRELKIPCIIGTKIATQILKDGDLVEVNANHGRVKILKRA